MRTRAAAVLPKHAPKLGISPRGSSRPRSYSQAQLLAFGPTIHLADAAIYPDLTRGVKVDAVELYVQMWMVDSQDRCMGGVAQWPTKQSAWVKQALHPIWNSARQLPGASYDNLMTLRVELWDAATDTLLGVARSALASLSTDAVTVALCKPDAEDDFDWRTSVKPAPAAGISPTSSLKELSGESAGKEEKSGGSKEEKGGGRHSAAKAAAKADGAERQSLSLIHI